MNSHDTVFVVVLLAVALMLGAAITQLAIFRLDSTRQLYINEGISQVRFEACKLGLAEYAVASDGAALFKRKQITGEKPR